MNLQVANRDLAERMPRVRGRLEANAPLGGQTWFGAGGKADILFKPADRDDLIYFLANRPKDVPLTTLGVGSNVLVRDGGVEGVVIRLGRPFSGIATIGVELFCGAAALDANIAKAGEHAGVEGLEFLAGVPGTVGGALVMNAGCYGSEIKDVFVMAEAVDHDGQIHVADAARMGFSYRHSQVPPDWIFISAVLRGHKGDREAIAARIGKIHADREEAQPQKVRTGGSTFKNPEGAKAWELIDKAGCRGLRKGGAAVSAKHCNFLVNEGNATASDIEDLGEEVRRRVREATGVQLEWEIRRIGRRPS
jgi:UDP-N-acetylmuramate dehydrogenase